MSKPIPLPFSSPVRGVSHRQDEVVLLNEGDRVRIVHEPDNAYDRNACAVYTDSGGMLGFVPAVIAGRLADRGEGSWRGTVTEVRRGDTWGVTIAVREPLGSLEVSNGAETGPEVVPDVRTPERVFARSGRPLGDLVRIEDTKVVVRTSTGAEVPYPRDLVRIGSVEGVPSGSEPVR